MEERVPARGTVDWFAPGADAAVHAYVLDPRADAVVVKKLIDVCRFETTSSS